MFTTDKDPLDFGNLGTRSKQKCQVRLRRSSRSLNQKREARQGVMTFLAIPIGVTNNLLQRACTTVHCVLRRSKVDIFGPHPSPSPAQRISHFHILTSSRPPIPDRTIINLTIINVTSKKKRKRQSIITSPFSFEQQTKPAKVRPNLQQASSRPFSPPRRSSSKHTYHASRSDANQTH
jgi:hypothetical protein